MITAETMIRVGIVSSVDLPKLKARVYLPDAGNMVSDWLYVIQRKPKYKVGEASSTITHTHTVEEDYWLPKVNDKVLVIYPCGIDKDAYIMGVIPG